MIMMARKRSFTARLTTGTALRYTSWVLFVLTVVLLLAAGHHAWWRGDLEWDVRTFYDRASFFLDRGTWSGIGYNEYQPGSLWFFVFLGSLTTDFHNYEAFLTVTMFVNVLLIVAHFLFFQKNGHRFAPLIFIGLLLACGPILLFRFELLVSLLVLHAWKCFHKGSLICAAFLLGVATSIKLYPVLLLPLICAEHLRRRRISDAAKEVGIFFTGMLLPVLTFFEFGGSMTDLLSSIKVHQLKAIGLEGFWGNLTVMVQRAMHIPLRVTLAFGIHGLTSDVPLLTESTITGVWICAIGVTFLAVLWRFRKSGYADPVLSLLLLMVFLYFSKVVNPQYLWWWASFFPLIPVRWYGRYMWPFAFLATLGSLLLTQIIYPLNYQSSFLPWFYSGTGSPLLFVISVGRNACFFVVLLLTLIRVFHQRTARRSRA